jgi:transcription factor STE12
MPFFQTASHLRASGTFTDVGRDQNVTNNHFYLARVCNGCISRFFSGDSMMHPGNEHCGHLHAQFHSQTLPLLSLSNPVVLSTVPMDQDTFSHSSDNQGGVEYTCSTPGLSGGLMRPLRLLERERLAHLDRLKFFLATAPSRWDSARAASVGTSTSSTSTVALAMIYPQSNGSGGINGMESLTTSMLPSLPTQGCPHSLHHPSLNRFLLPSEEYVTCVLWNGLYHITGTDIVRVLVFRFEVRPLVL